MVSGKPWYLGANQTISKYQKREPCVAEPEGSAPQALAPDPDRAAPQGIATRSLRRRTRVNFARESALEIKSVRGFDRKRKRSTLQQASQS